MFHLARKQDEVFTNHTNKKEENILKNQVIGTVGVITTNSAYGKHIQNFVAFDSEFNNRDNGYTALENKRQEVSKEEGVPATITTYPYIATEKHKGYFKTLLNVK